MKVAKNKAVIAFLLCFIMLFNVTSTVVEAFGSFGFKDSEISFGEGEYNIQIDDSNSRYTVVSFTPVSDEEDMEIKAEIAAKENSVEEEKVDLSKFYRSSRQKRDLSTQGIDFTTYFTTVRVDVETDPTVAEGFPWDTAFPVGIDLTIRSFDDFEVFETQTLKVTKEGMVEFPEKMRVYNENGKKLVFSISVPKEIDINPIIEQIYGTGNYSDGTKVFTMSATFVQILSTKFTTEWHSTKDASTFPNLRGTFNVGQGTYAFNLPKDGEYTIIRNDNGDQRLVSPDILSPKIPEHAVRLGIEGAGIKEGKVDGYFFETVYSKLNGGIFKFYEIMTITLDANGGTVTPDIKEVGYTKPGGELPTPTPPTGKTFSKWVYEDGSDYDPTAAVNSNITVKADYGDKPFDPDKVVGMKITTPPDKVDYKVGEKFDPTGMKVTLTDINGITKVVPYADFDANNLSVPTDKELALADTKVTVTYEKGITKLTDDQPITVSDYEFDPDNVVGMKITTPPDKVDYKVGEKFDPTGMKVTLTDKNGKTKVVPYEDFAANNLSVPTDKALTLSDTKVTVTYEKGSTKLTDDQPIKVTEHEFDPDNVVGMKITTPPDKVDYKVGEKFDPTGMKVTLTDKNGITKVVPYADFAANNLSVPTDKALALSDKKVTVTYEKGSTKLTDDQPITVSDYDFDPDNVVGMKITTPPNKVNYIEGEKFQPQGMKVTLTDKNGKTKVVPYADFAANNLSVPTDKALTLDDKAVTVTYQKGNTKLTDDQPITVRKASVEKVTIRFLSGSHGTLIGNTVITVDVGTPFSEVRARMPRVSPFSGYTHTGWSPSLPSGTTPVTRSATYTATYKLTDNVIPVDPTDPIPEDYVRVIFLPGTDGRLIGNTHFNVRIGTPFREVRAKMPTVSPYSGYYHYGWNPSLPLDSTPVYRGATYTAVYRRTTSSIDDGFILWPISPSQPSVTVTVPTLPQSKPTLIKDDHFAYIKGYPDGTFKGEASITRGEVAAIFARLVKGGITGIEAGATYYSDVKVTDWYHDSIAFLSKHKIIEGYPDGTFRPEKPITRAEFSAIASRFSNVSGGNSNFSDVPSSHWAKRYIDFAYTEGWITGYPDGTFRPDRNITRAEAVTMVNKVLNRSADKKYVDNNLALLVRFSDLNNDYWAYYNIIEAANSHDYTRNADGSETWIRVR